MLGLGAGWELGHPSPGPGLGAATFEFRLGSVAACDLIADVTNAFEAAGWNHPAALSMHKTVRTVLGGVAWFDE